VNLLWPRAVYGDWYLNWGVLIMTGALGVIGGLLCWRVLPAGPPGEVITEERAVQAPARETS